MCCPLEANVLPFFTATLPPTPNPSYPAFTMSKTESSRVAEYPVVHENDRGISSNVPVKYRGTQADRRDMSALGKKQVLRRQFGFFYNVGICFNGDGGVGICPPRLSVWVARWRNTSRLLGPVYLPFRHAADVRLTS